MANFGTVNVVTSKRKNCPQHRSVQLFICIFFLCATAMYAKALKRTATAPAPPQQSAVRSDYRYTKI